MNIFATVLAGLLSSDQGSSLLRSLLKIGGTALLTKTAVSADPSTLDAIVGGGMAMIGVFQSWLTHTATTAATPAKTTAPAAAA